MTLEELDAEIAARNDAITGNTVCDPCTFKRERPTEAKPGTPMYVHEYIVAIGYYATHAELFRLYREDRNTYNTLREMAIAEMQDKGIPVILSANDNRHIHKGDN